MKKTILLVLVLALGLAAKVANTDFTFGNPGIPGPPVNGSVPDGGASVSAEGELTRFDSNQSGVYSQETGEGEIPLTVAAVCMNAKTDVAANLDTFTAYISEASEKGACLIVFPEIALQQNPGWGTSSYLPTEAELEYVHDSAETIPGPSTEVLVQIAREHSIFVIFGMTEKSLNGDLYNTSVFLGPTGILGKHRKGILWDSGTGGNEHLFWMRGSDNGLVDSPLGRVGLIICIEMYYLLGRNLGNAGADFLVTVSAWPSSSGSFYESYTKRNAVESGRWHVVANQVGMVGYATDYGHSRIINPEGVVVADTGAQEGMVIAQIGYFNWAGNVDLNGDGFVDCSDLCIIVDHWGTDEPSCDLAPPPFGDGIVDVQDLIFVAEHLFEEFPPVEPEEVNVNEEDDGSQIELEQDQILVVTLESNPTTGYRWEQAETQESILEQMGEAEFKPSETGEPPLVGAGGWEIFRFKAISAGRMTLQLVYHRPWEEGVEPVKTFSIQVVVN